MCDEAQVSPSNVTSFRTSDSIGILLLLLPSLSLTLLYLPYIVPIVLVRGVRKSIDLFDQDILKKKKRERVLKRGKELM